jgi:ABC-type phosphate transport system substrate-binding protein
MKNKIKHSYLRGCHIFVTILLLLLVTVNCQAQIAIIVNKSNPISEISLNELKAIFLGKQAYFKDNTTPIILVDFKSDVDEFCQKVYGYSGKTMNKHWFQLIFSGTSVNVPKKVTSIENLFDFIANNENAIGYINLKNIPANAQGYKILKIDGTLPGNASYLLGNNNLVKPENNIQTVNID